MATLTITTTVLSTVTAAAAKPTATGASPQGGILEGILPNVVSTSNPINLFIIQVRPRALSSSLASLLFLLALFPLSICHLPFRLPYSALRFPSSPFPYQFVFFNDFIMVSPMTVHNVTL